MPTTLHQSMTLATVAALLWLPGCMERTGQGAAPPEGPSGTRLAGARDDINTLPPAVAAAFRNDFPGAGVTNVSQTSAETGDPLIRITFIQPSGQPGNATYFLNGQRLPNPPTTTVPPPPPTNTTPR